MCVLIEVLILRLLGCLAARGVRYNIFMVISIDIDVGGRIFCESGWRWRRQVQYDTVRHVGKFEFLPPKRVLIPKWLVKIRYQNFFDGEWKTLLNNTSDYGKRIHQNDIFLSVLIRNIWVAGVWCSSWHPLDAFLNYAARKNVFLKFEKHNLWIPLY